MGNSLISLGDDADGVVIVRKLAVNVVLNVGWCQDSGSEWVRPGDYISINSFQVNLQRNKNIFFKNAQLKCHGKKQEDLGVIFIFNLNCLAPQPQSMDSYTQSILRWFR